MKKVIFYLSFVFCFLLTVDANALGVLPNPWFKFSRQESTHFSQHSQSENLFLVDHLMDIEEDEITDTATDKFSIEKVAIKSNTFLITDFHANIFRNILVNQSLYHRQSSHFISLRALKL